jgi:hypothetical protein
MQLICSLSVILPSLLAVKYWVDLITKSLSKQICGITQEYCSRGAESRDLLHRMLEKCLYLSKNKRQAWKVMSPSCFEVAYRLYRITLASPLRPEFFESSLEAQPSACPSVPGHLNQKFHSRSFAVYYCFVCPRRGALFIYKNRLRFIAS